MPRGAWRCSETRSGGLAPAATTFQIDCERSAIRVIRRERPGGFRQSHLGGNHHNIEDSRLKSDVMPTLENATSSAVPVSFNPFGTQARETSVWSGRRNVRDQALWQIAPSSGYPQRGDDCVFPVSGHLQRCAISAPQVHR